MQGLKESFSVKTSLGCPHLIEEEGMFVKIMVHWFSIPAGLAGMKWDLGRA